MVHACVVGDGDVMWQFQRYRREGGGGICHREEEKQNTGFMKCIFKT